MIISLRVNEKYNGFTLCEVENVEAIESTLYRFRHDKTGAELIFSDRADENKAFAVAFKTTPFDDTGVFHILEHSVFCGSEKYPVKDPFIRMLQTSMQTFLNAMTFPDKTVYPVSSRNDKDFRNLIDVYLDAVFHPAFLQNPNVFYQEGWHYEVDEDGTPFPQGIVYSEMQGVFSGLDGEIESAVSRALYRGTSYEYVYGGHPDAILNLTYEKFCETYYEYYSPSNAVLVLDGSMELGPILEYLDNILNNTDHSDRTENSIHSDRTENSIHSDRTKISIPKQENFTPVTGRCFYDVSGEETGGRDVLVLARIVGNFDTKKENVAVNMLCSYLCGSNESPLKRALLDTGLCEDVRLYTQDDCIQPMLVLEVRGSKEEDFEKLRSIISKTIDEIVMNGMDKSELEAVLAALTFSEKERSANFALGVISKILQSCLYGGDMAQNLSFGETLAELKKEIETDYYEKLLAGVFEPEKFSTLSFIAKSGLHTEKQAGLYEKMLSLRDELGNDGIAKLAETAEKLLVWQETDDFAEAAGFLPILTLSDVEKELPIIPIEEKPGEITLLAIPAENPDITYLRMYFAVPESVENRLFELSILTNMLTNLPTERYSTKELQKELCKTIGSISFDILTVDEEKNTCKAYLVIALSVLNENVNAAFALISEILLRTRFDDSSRIEELLSQIRTMMRDSLAADGHKYAAVRALSGLSASAVFHEITGGYTAIQKLEALLGDFEKKHLLLTDTFHNILTDMIGKDNLTIAVCGSPIQAECTAFANTLPRGNSCDTGLFVQMQKQSREGIAIPGDISFASLGGHLEGNADAAAYLAGHILSYEYLWNEIRVQNGAYGAGLQVKENGEMAFYSYRDPSAENSLTVYQNASSWLCEAAENMPDLDAVKIGTINELDPLLTASQKLSIAANGYFTGRGYEYKADIRRKLFDVTSEELKGFAQRLAKQTENQQICVVGSAETLKKAKLKRIF
ncbi:MAG: insulinase family protein [Lachnospiraceae bacterium]|nr:insulinase family protein [Lachnospiraceae bacterium]